MQASNLPAFVAGAINPINLKLCTEIITTY